MGDEVAMKIATERPPTATDDDVVSRLVRAAVGTRFTKDVRGPVDQSLQRRSGQDRHTLTAMLQRELYGWVTRATSLSIHAISAFPASSSQTCANEGKT